MNSAVPCPNGRTDYEACYAPFAYCPVRGCGQPIGLTPMERNAALDTVALIEAVRKEDVRAVYELVRVIDKEAVLHCMTGLAATVLDAIGDTAPGWSAGFLDYTRKQALSDDIG